MKAERIQLALDVGRTGIWVWDVEAASFAGDLGISNLWGLPPDTAMTMDLFRKSWHPEDAARVSEEMGIASSPGGAETCRIEFRILKQDGTERWVSLDGRRYRPYGETGRLELIGMARDITLGKQRESHMHLLMREVTHRSKNLLAIIQAMARQTVKDSLTAAEFEERFSARLRGLAVSHELLAARDWHGASVEDLVRWHLGIALDKAHDQIGISGPPVLLKPEAAQNLGLAFNELITNATRFGALSAAGGKVAIEWSLDDITHDQARFHISWRESGGPEVQPPRRYGFGHKVTERLAARALDGTVSLTFAASGLQWALHIPASFVLRGETPLHLN